MAVNPLKAFLFAAGGSVVVAGAAYVSGALDPYLGRTPPANVAAPAKPAAVAPAAPAPTTPAPATNAMAPAAPAGGTMAAAKPAAPSEPAPAPAVTAAPEKAASAAPTFDVVRVESNGSIVVAGNAAPNSKVEILNGSTMLGSATAGPDGAFVIILDDPLKPGDYTITLRSTLADKTVVASSQTAVISVPSTPSGQVLAMVEEPGKPSELLTVPAPEKKPEAAAANEPAAKPAAAEAPAQPAAATPVPAASAAPATAAAPATTQPAAPAAPAATAEATPAPAQPAVPVQPAAPAVAAPKVVVEAVEIDGNKIFVAGLADPGRKVRAYADDILLGDAQTSPDGHFLVEAARDLPVGSHTIHVDALGDDGVKVVARAAVPFEREPGESIAAVAPETKPAEAKPAETKPAETKVAEAKPAEAKPTEVKPAETSSAEAKPAEAKPAVSAAAEAPAAPAAEAKPAASPAPAAEAPAKVAEATPATDVPETVAPKLEHADGAVIIRRHDTLWRISRRVYGHGVRYSTIYLANQDQIRDPDRIWPGQVFKLPGKSKEGEDADMKAMGDQMTSVPAKTE